MGQQREEQGAEHTALGGRTLDVLLPTRAAVRSLVEEVQQPVAQGRAEPQLVQFADQLLRDEGVKC